MKKELTWVDAVILSVIWIMGGIYSITSQSIDGLGFSTMSIFIYFVGKLLIQ